jgi:hypothetical protein
LEVELVSSEEEIAVPQMVGFEVLTKIIIGYLKVGADREGKTAAEVAAVAKVSRDNVARNARFFRSISIVEGSRGRYRLTPDGTQYAKSLDWGRLDEANKLLRELLKDRLLVRRVLGFVDINEPVSREALVSQIAIIAGVSREPRYETGIRGFVDMLVTSVLLEESAEGYLVSRKPAKERIPEKKKTREIYPAPTVEIEPPEPITFPISLNFNIDNETDIENLKKILKAIKEVFSED